MKSYVTVCKRCKTNIGKQESSNSYENAKSLKDYEKAEVFARRWKNKRDDRLIGFSLSRGPLDVSIVGWTGALFEGENTWDRLNTEQQSQPSFEEHPSIQICSLNSRNISFNSSILIACRGRLCWMMCNIKQRYRPGMLLLVFHSLWAIWSTHGQPCLRPTSKNLWAEQTRELLPGLFETCDTVTAVQPGGCLAVNKCTI